MDSPPAGSSTSLARSTSYASVQEEVQDTVSGSEPASERNESAASARGSLRWPRRLWYGPTSRRAEDAAGSLAPAPSGGQTGADAGGSAERAGETSRGWSSWWQSTQLARWFESWSYADAAEELPESTAGTSSRCPSDGETSSLGWLQGARSMRTSMKWFHAEALHIAGDMIQSDEERKMPRQEFELSDLLQACAKASDLSMHLGEMPPLFWIFLITLLFNIVYLAFAIMEVWVEAVLRHYGLLAYALLLTVSVITWPAFIHYLIQSLIHGKRVMELCQRTVQFHGMPPSFRTEEAIERFCRERNLNVSGVSVPTAIADGMTMPPIEVCFQSIVEMKTAFRENALKPVMRLEGVEVRVRPKVGTNSAMVEQWLVCIKYLNESVPEGYWLRATLSCLVTMSLARHVTEHLVLLASSTRRYFGLLGWLMTRLGSFLSLVALFFFVGYHAYRDIRDAREELRSVATDLQAGGRHGTPTVWRVPPATTRSLRGEARSSPATATASSREASATAPVSGTAGEDCLASASADGEADRSESRLDRKLTWPFAQGRLSRRGSKTGSPATEEPNS